jgi:Glyoxalase/Bleomycin resistance protein/Dioxygenase superfamily
MSAIRPTRPPEGLFTEPRRVETVADLLANVWQYGYVTTDLDRALEMLGERFGLEHCITVDTAGSSFMVGDQPAEWEARFGMGARGGPIVEVIEPVSGAVDFYRRFLPSDGSFALRFHHLAVFVETGDAEWERIRGILAAAGMGFDYTMVIPGRVRAGYIDTSAELGHLLEVCQLQRDDLDFFSSLTADSA